MERMDENPNIFNKIAYNSKKSVADKILLLLLKIGHRRDFFQFSRNLQLSRIELYIGVKLFANISVQSLIT